MLDILVGTLLVLLGGSCVVSGIVVALTERRKGVGGFPLPEVTSALKALAEVLKALKDLPAGSQLVVLGLLLVGGGVWLLEARPL